MTQTVDPRVGDGSVRATIRAYILARTGENGLGDDDDFFELGVANSLFAMELITFVEREFGLTVEVEDLRLDNFRSISACTSFVALRGRRP